MYAFSLLFTALASVAVATPIDTLADRQAANCNAFYRVQPDDFCSSATLGKKFGNFTYTQLLKWNPSMSQGCFLTAFTTICVGSPDYTFVPPVQSPPDTIVSQDALPVPIIGCAVSECKTWQMIGAGTRSSQVIARNSKS
jgi:hypothetical protein